MACTYFLHYIPASRSLRRDWKSSLFAGCWAALLRVLRVLRTAECRLAMPFTVMSFAKIRVEKQLHVPSVSANIFYIGTLLINLSTETVHKCLLSD